MNVGRDETLLDAIWMCSGVLMQLIVFIYIKNWLQLIFDFGNSSFEVSEVKISKFLWNLS